MWSLRTSSLRTCEAMMSGFVVKDWAKDVPTSADYIHTESGESPGEGGGVCWASLQKSFRRLFAKQLSLNSFMDEDFLQAFCDNSNQSCAKILLCVSMARFFAKNISQRYFLKK